MLNEPVAPSKQDADLAKESSRKLAALAATLSQTVEVEIVAGGRKVEKIVLPRGAVDLLTQLLTEMSRGNAVTLMPVRAMLTTQQAARLLGVSRPFVIKEIQAGRLQHQAVGTHRRIPLPSVLKYRQAQMMAHDQAMNELVSQAQELGMGY
jgi:excisionase family DNA binding protein